MTDTTAATPTAEQHQAAAETAAAAYAKQRTDFIAVLVPVLQQVVDTWREFGRTLQSAGVLDVNLTPVRRGVAAQASPYGPAPKHPQRR